MHDRIGQDAARPARPPLPGRLSSRSPLGPACPPTTYRLCVPAGWVAYLGAANAGIPLSIIVKDYGWGAYFTGGWPPGCNEGSDARRGKALVHAAAAQRGCAADRVGRLGHRQPARLVAEPPLAPRARAQLTATDKASPCHCPCAALLAACAGAVVLLAPMINAKSYVQLEDERKAAAAKLA